MNARILEQLKEQSFVGGNLIILISTALTASGVIVSFNIADFGLSGFRDRIKNEQTQFITPNEQIYAVQYRKIC